MSGISNARAIEFMVSSHAPARMFQFALPRPLFRFSAPKPQLPQLFRFAQASHSKEPDEGFRFTADGTVVPV